MTAEAATIRQLSEEVSSRIAAGEVVQRPVNALKEMIENSLDAGATSIAVVAKDGGLKHLSISDNGHGIRLADFPLLCERFATSKLRDMDDFKRLRTFGFRGEALASISFVSRIMVTSMTPNADCAYRAHFSDGKLVSLRPGEPAVPKPCAGTVGTHIVVEDMFYNAQVRIKAFKSPNEDYRLILDMMGRYAIHFHRTAFSCKKHGEMHADLNTAVAATPIDAIRTIFGTDIARDLLYLKEKNSALSVEVEMRVSHPQMQSNKKAIFMLLINVDSAAMKRTMENPYTAYLPKGSHPFVYLSLTLDPANIDANISPTKSEVHILHEDEILQWLQELLLALLSKSMTERALLDASSPSQIPTPRTPAVAQLPQHLVRTDSSVNTMTSYLSRASSDLPPSASPLPIAPTKKRRVFRPPMLASVEQLLDRLEREAESGWEKRLAEHVYVGKLDNMRVLLQFGTALSIANVGALSEEYFYQIALRNFGHHGSLKITPTAPSVSKLLLLGLQVRGTAKEKRDGIVMEAMSVIMHWREMLSDYFAITIDLEGNLLSLPLLLENWVPDWLGLPNFLLQLAVSDFTDEARAFDSIAVHLSHLYRYTTRQPVDYVSLLLLPAARDGVWLPKRFFDEGGLVQLTSVEQLYKVFERC